MLKSSINSFRFQGRVITYESTDIHSCANDNSNYSLAIFTVLMCYEY